MNTRFRSLLLLLSAALVVCIHGCRKHDKPLIITVPDPEVPKYVPPTKELTGKYIWHGMLRKYQNGKDTMIEGTVIDEIVAMNDTTLSFKSEQDYASPTNKVPVYMYFSSNDSEVVYRYTSKYSLRTITYKLKRNLIIWDNGTSILYGVPGQTEKWAPLHEAKLNAIRNWHMTRIFRFNKDSTITLPDTTGSAYSMHKIVYSDPLSVGGADSTGVVYYGFYMGAAYRNVIASISYYAWNNSIHMYRGIPLGKFYGNIYYFDTF